MANKKVSQLTSKPAVNLTDLFLIADPTSGQAFKTTISDLGTAIGSGVSSVNTLVGAVVLDTDDIQELASPTNRWFTDTRARAAISAGTGISYNSGTGVITNAVTSGQIATALGYTPANDANVVKLTGDQTIAGNKTFSAGTKHDNAVLLKHDFATVESGYNTISAKTNGLVLWIGGVTRYHDLLFSTSANYVYTFPSATGTLALTSNLSAYLPLTGGTLTGDLTISSGNPRLYFTDTDNNPDYFISNTDGTFTVYDVTNSTSRFTIGTTGNATFTNAITGGGSITGESIYSNGIVSVGTGLTVGTTISATGSITGASIIRSGGTSSQFLKADGSVDSTAYLPLGGGTLTGALFATSASFSGFVGFGGNTSPLAAIDVTGAGRFSSTISAAGATLTGALSGTSASFSGNVDFKGETIIDGNNFYLKTTALNTDLALNYNGKTTASLIFYSGTTPRLTITSAGAATFSSSVTANGTLTVNEDGAGTKVLTIRSNWAGVDPAINVTTSNSLLLMTANTERMRITSAGNVGIGTTAPTQGKLVVSNAGPSVIANRETSVGVNSSWNASDGSVTFFGNESNHPLAFTTNGSERMRITSGGDVLIGTTSNVGGKLQVNGDVRAYGSFFRETGNITVNNSWTNVFTINTTSQRTYLLQIIATNSEASLSYRYFGVIQGNPASSSYTSVSLASQTMEVQLSGATIQTRLTNSNQFNFNWSITQLL